MDAVIHLTDPGPDHWRRTTTPTNRLTEPDRKTPFDDLAYLARSEHRGQH